MKILKTTFYPNNAGKKHCVLAGGDKSKRTFWGNSEEEAVNNAKKNMK